MELVLYTRRDCELCHEMESVLDEVVPRFGAQVQRVEIDGVEVSWRFRTELTTMPASSAVGRRGDSRRRGRRRYRGDFAQIILHFDPQALRGKQRASADA